MRPLTLSVLPEGNILIPSGKQCKKTDICSPRGRAKETVLYVSIVTYTSANANVFFPFMRKILKASIKVF